MNKIDHSFPCRGCPVGCGAPASATAGAPPSNLTQVVAIVYGMPLVVLIGAVAGVHLLSEVNALQALLLIGTMLTLCLMLIARRGAALVNLLAPAATSTRNSE